MNRGFSLVELSIVLVILGLLTGGILAGQSLIRAAALRAIITRVDKYHAATYAFRDKYLALPGDMSNATKFWGKFGDAGTGSCFTSPGTGTEVCDGNGDGYVGNLDATGHIERYAYWKELANAGLIEGTYPGNIPSPSTRNTPGVDVPALPVDNAGISVRAIPNVSSGATSHFYGNYGNLYEIGKETTGGYTNTPFLATEEAWNLDTKRDDGKPGTGIMRTRNAGNSTATNCTDSSDPAAAATAQYKLSYSGAACSLLYIWAP